MVRAADVDGEQRARVVAEAVRDRRVGERAPRRSPESTSHRTAGAAPDLDRERRRRRRGAHAAAPVANAQSAPRRDPRARAANAATAARVRAARRGIERPPVASPLPSRVVASGGVTLPRPSAGLEAAT